MSEENEPYVNPDYQEPQGDPAQPPEGEPSEPTEEPGAEPGTEEPTDDPPAEPQEKEKGVQKRIDELTRKRREAEREAEYWKAKAIGKEGATEPRREDTTTIPASQTGKPTADQYDNYEDFLEALSDWKTDQKIAQREFTARQQREQEERQKALQTHTSRVEKAKEVYEDFEEVLDDARDITMPDETLLTIIESEHSADIVYHLAKNRALALKIAAMSPKRQLIEIGKLEERLEKAEKPVKRITKAPEPVKAVGGKGTVTKSPEDMSDDEWLKAERARCARQGRLY